MAFTPKSHTNFLFLLRPENFAFYGVLWQTPVELSCDFTEECLHLATLHHRAGWWKLLLSPQSSVNVTIRFLVTSLIKTFLPQSLRLAGWLDLEDSCWFQTSSSYGWWRPLCSLGPFKAAEIFQYHSPGLILDTILQVCRQFLDFLAWFILWEVQSAMASYIDCRVSFQIMSSQLNLLQYKLEKHLTDDQGKQDPPELNYECHGNMYLIHVILLFCFF